jgi:SOS-response transcriptional repressor LexA
VLDGKDQVRRIKAVASAKTTLHRTKTSGKKADRCSPTPSPASAAQHRDEKADRLALKNRQLAISPAWSRQYLEVVAPDDALTGFDTIYGRIPAGPARPEEEGDLGRLVMDLSAVGIPTTDKTFALREEGDSMSGAGINDGDILVLERREPRSGDIVAALVDRQVTLKRYVLGNEGEPILRAENPNHGDIVPHEDLSVQGVAVGLIRKL